MMPPVDLPLPKLVLWLTQEAYKGVTEAVGTRDVFMEEDKQVIYWRDKKGLERDLQFIEGYVEQMHSAIEDAEKRLERPGLTRRQREILELRAQGRTTRDIAARLGISKSTVRQHLHRTVR